MSSVVISGDTSGAITVSAPAVAGTNTLTLQAATATNAVNTLATAQASTSGTFIDFTGLPSWIKRITVIFNGVSTNGSSLMLIQVGAGSITNTGYTSNSWSNNTLSATSTAGFVLTAGMQSTGLYSGQVSLLRPDATAIVQSSVLGSDVANTVHVSGGRVVLGGALDRVRLTTVNGTDTFDAGTINILYEG